MNYPAMRAVAEYHQLEGPGRAILWALSYRANSDGEFWAGQRRIAREAGVSRKSVERWLPRLVGRGVLEALEEGTGPRPDGYRFAPEWVEGEAGGSGVVEGQASATDVVEGTSEVIHSTAASGDTESPVTSAHDELVATLLRASGDSQSAGGELVATPENGSGYSQSLSPAETPPKVLIQGSSTSRSVQGVGAEPNADALGADGAYTPPEVSEAQREWLRRRGLGQRQPPPVARLAPPPPDQPAPTRDRDAQLAELERRYPEQFKSGQEQGPAVAVQAHAGVAEGNGTAYDATAAVTAHAQSAMVTVVAADAEVRAVGEIRAEGEVHGEQRTSGRTTGQRVDLDGEAGAGTDALAVLRVVNE
jgi:hypothetical protein